jgi:hypothetical protein
MVQKAQRITSPSSGLMRTLRQVQQLSAELVVDDLGYTNLETYVLEEPSGDRDHRPGLFDYRLYDLPEYVGIQKKRKGHCQRNFGRSRSKSA